MLSLLFLLSVPGVSLTEVADYPFRNTSLNWKERVDDLVYRLTLEVLRLMLSFLELHRTRV